MEEAPFLLQPLMIFCQSSLFTFCFAALVGVSPTSKGYRKEGSAFFSLSLLCLDIMGRAHVILLLKTSCKIAL